MPQISFVTGVAERQYFLNSHKKVVKDMLKTTNFSVKQNYQIFLPFQNMLITRYLEIRVLINE